jgi:hypothetical protein
VAEFSELEVQVTLTVNELRDLVAMVNLAAEVLPEDEAIPDIVDEVSRLYFELMENLKDGILGDFQPE